MPAELAGGRNIVLPFSKTVEISFRSLKIRFGRSLITTSGVILAIAFLMSVWSNNAIIDGLRGANKNDINLLLMQNGIETGICVVGIANAMLMSVTERFREIGTMKCLGALDSFIVRLFLLESTFQGLAGTSLGILIGLAMTMLLAMMDYGYFVFDYFPSASIVQSAGYALVVGTVLSLVGAMLPAYRAAKMEPVEAMRVEN